MRISQKLLLVALLLILCLGIFFAAYNNNFRWSGFLSSDRVLISTHIDPEYSKVTPGGEISLGVAIARLGGGEQDLKDVEVKMFAYGDDNKKFLISSQTVALDTQLSIVFHANLPQKIKSDSYTLYIEVDDVNTGEVLGTTSQRIIVANGFYVKFSKNVGSYLIVGIIIFIATALLVVLVTRFQGHQEVHFHESRGFTVAKHLNKMRKNKHKR